MSFPLRSPFHFLGLGVLSIALSGCNIAATPYLWRSYAESASIINLGLTTTVTSTTGVTFQLLRGSNGSLLRKLESDGTLGWQQELVDSTFERLLLSGTSVILVDADNTATQLSDTGDTRWVRSLAPKTAALQSIISKNGRLTVIYHAESEFIAHVETIDADNGSTLWTQAIGDAANLQFDTLATGTQMKQEKRY